MSPYVYLLRDQFSTNNLLNVQCEGYTYRDVFTSTGGLSEESALALCASGGSLQCDLNTSKMTKVVTEVHTTVWYTPTNSLSHVSVSVVLADVQGSSSPFSM